jgi:hypothetical protein
MPSVARYAIDDIAVSRVICVILLGSPLPEAQTLPNLKLTQQKANT